MPLKSRTKMSKALKFEISEGINMVFPGASTLSSVEEIGIDNLKKVAEFSIHFRNKIIKFRKDGKIRLFEKFGIGILVMSSLRLVPMWPMVKKELADLDESEYLELLDIVSEGFGFSSELARDYFEDFINFIDAIKTFFEKNEQGFTKIV